MSHGGTILFFLLFCFGSFLRLFFLAFSYLDLLPEFLAESVKVFHIFINNGLAGCLWVGDFVQGDRHIRYFC